MIIGTLIVLAFLIAYIMGIVEMLEFLPFLIALVLVCVLTVVFTRIVGRTEYSAGQNARIREAEVLDRENALLNAEESKKQEREEAIQID